ncbi:MAG TPA: toxin-antitoxin system HicB family antitoxin [Acidobacteriota bacterium]|nr:toxin-antitoxin system HicB family antitoxin [Acidobacteriota bacterium]HNG94797.1 toxin-antitoxin system HicB family antitoxin [Acidobacteriota bacterium]HNH82308.1 toxin-antitoxin system HicB family antitoxin [Acidobacteriota bacterium]
MSTITVNLPDSLYDRLKEVAEKDRSTPEQLVLVAITEKLSVLLTVEYLETRAKRANPERLNQLLAKVPSVEAEPHDKLS